MIFFKSQKNVLIVMISTLMMTEKLDNPGLLEIKLSWMKGCEVIISIHDAFIVPYVREIVVRKNLTTSQGWHWARFYILIWLSFPKIETKNFNSDPCFFRVVKLGTMPPTAFFFDCVHIRRRHTIAAIFRGLSSGKRSVKLRKVFRLQT